MKIPLNEPKIGDLAQRYVEKVLQGGRVQGNGEFTERAQQWLSEYIGGLPLLTHSCTGALEMAMLLADLEVGDEVILPSFTFVSTATAVVSCGAVPVFVDIRADTCNLNEHLIEAAITEKTKAIIVVHYAGICCNMDTIRNVATRYKLLVVEDAAQALMSSYKGVPAGALSDLACFSFHETKNVISGEGGALIVNDPALEDRARIIRDKGTNRHRFLEGQVDKYTWVDKGSSFLLSDLLAALLYAQLQEAEDLTRARLRHWQNYHSQLEDMERAGRLRRMSVPAECLHNGHIYYVRLENAERRRHVMEQLNKQGIGAAFHYIPLHSSPAGKRFGRVSGDLQVTNEVSETLLRLPLFPEMGHKADIVLDNLRECC